MDKIENSVDLMKTLRRSLDCEKFYYLKDNHVKELIKQINEENSLSSTKEIRNRLYNKIDVAEELNTTYNQKLSSLLNGSTSNEFITVTLPSTNICEINKYLLLI